MTLSPVVSLNCMHVQMLNFVERSNNAASLSAVASCRIKSEVSCSNMGEKQAERHKNKTSTCFHCRFLLQDQASSCFFFFLFLKKPAFYY